MPITPANYGPFVTTLDTTLGHLYSQMDPKFNAREIATEVPMSGSIWTTAWTGRLPKARPWFGPRVIHEPAAQTYSVAPIPYELTYGFDQFLLDDSDVNGQSPFWRMLPDMAMQWRRWESYELRDLVEGTGVQAGTNGVGGNRQNGLDGLRAYSTAHPINIYLPSFNGGGNALFSAGTYCNDFTGGGVTINGTLIGGPLGQSSFSSLLQYVQMIPDESGEPLGVIPDVMMIPSTLQIEANFILTASFLASPIWGAFSPLTGQVGSADNMLRKTGVRPLVNPWLRNTKNWHLLDTSHSMKPWLWVQREAPRTVPRVNATDPIVFDLHKYIWGGWARGTPAWNFSWLFFRSGP